MRIFLASSVYSGRGLNVISTGFSMPVAGAFGAGAADLGSVAVSANPEAMTEPPRPEVPRPPGTPPASNPVSVEATTEPLRPAAPRPPGTPLASNPVSVPMPSGLPTRVCALDVRVSASPNPEASVLRATGAVTVGEATVEKTFVTTTGGAGAGSAFASPNGIGGGGGNGVTRGGGSGMAGAGRASVIRTS